MNELEVKKRMQKVVDMILGDLSSLRTGRASSSIINNLEISVYGGQQKLRIEELGTISLVDNQNLIIEPWDKSIIGEIRQGILSANVGINPMIDGEKIRISFPALTTEDRDKYIRLLNTKLENGRIMVRQIRGDEMKHIKDIFEKKELSEDEKFESEKNLQQITDEYIGKINDAGEKKKEELLAI